MVFNSIDFLIFFPIVILVYFIIPIRLRYIWLLIVNYYFYMYWNPVYSVFLLTVTMITYLSAIGIEKIQDNLELKENKRHNLSKILFGGSIAVNLGMLAYFKYANFFRELINKLLSRFSLEQIHEFDILLPLGISFYMFTSLGYLTDVYCRKCKAEKKFGKYALFVSFYPMILSGPIERSHNLLKQIQEKQKKCIWNYDRVTSGLMTMLWGFFLKLVIADRITVLVDKVFLEFERYGMVALGIGAIAYAIQIYCDFNSYSLIALGTARVLGFELINNFETPYFAQSITEFWRRWHISLSSWFRDYVYIPLGGNRKGKWRQYLNILITFSISGLWHGANLTFIFWGFLHGFYQIVEKEVRVIVRKINGKLQTKTESFGYKFTKIIFTFIAVDLAWIFFRAESLRHALHYLERMVCYRDWWSLFDGSIYQLGLDIREIHILCLGVLLAFVMDLVQYVKKWSFAEFMAEQWIVFRWCVLILVLIGCVVFGYYGPGFDSVQFIYLQF